MPSTRTSTKQGWREYLRVSLDTSGQERSVKEQHDENARAAKDHGATLGAAYKDNSISASRYSRKPRGNFAKLLDDLEHNRFDADVLVIWESSRGSRRVGEWVLLIDLCEEAKVHIFVTTHGRTYDPGNPRDRRTLLEDAVDSEYEAGKASLRIKRSAAASAQAGRPHGRVPYGYRRLYDPRTGKFAAQEPDPVEAPIVRELFDRIAAGHSLRSIAVDFDRRDIRRRDGEAFSSQDLRSLALAPATAGFRRYLPGHPGGVTRSKLTADALLPGIWQPIVEPGVWYAVREILCDPARITQRPGRGKHLLSMIARCDVCGGPLAVTFRGGSHGKPHGRREYQCHTGGHVRVRADELDDFATGQILNYLARPDVYEGLNADGDGDGRLEAVRAELIAARSRLDELADAYADGAKNIRAFTRAEAKLTATITTLEAQERELMTPPALGRLMEPSADVDQRWDAAPMSTKREVARLLFSPAWLGELRVTRSPTPGHAVPVDVRVEWGAVADDAKDDVA